MLCLSIHPQVSNNKLPISFHQTWHGGPIIKPVCNYGSHYFFNKQFCLLLNARY
jgi:hypothetical protein